MSTQVADPVLLPSHLLHPSTLKRSRWECGLDQASPILVVNLCSYTYPQTLVFALRDYLQLRQPTLHPARNVTQVRLLKLSLWQPSPVVSTKPVYPLLSANLTTTFPYT